MDYIANQIMNAKIVELYTESNPNKPLIINNILNEDEITNYLSIDGNKVYMINNTISYNSDSAGIVADISSVEIEYKKMAYIWLKLMVKILIESFLRVHI